MSANNITKTLLIVSKNKDILNIGFSEKEKITYFETNKFYLLNSAISNFDLIIFIVIDFRIQFQFLRLKSIKILIFIFY